MSCAGEQARVDVLILKAAEANAHAMTLCSYEVFEAESTTSRLQCARCHVFGFLVADELDFPPSKPQRQKWRWGQERVLPSQIHSGKLVYLICQ